MVCFSKNIVSKLKVKLCIHVQGIATSLVVLFIAMLLHIFDKIFTAMLLIFFNVVVIPGQ